MKVKKIAAGVVAGAALMSAGGGGCICIPE